MKFSATYKNLKNIVRYIRKEVLIYTTSQEFIFDIELASEEIIINIIKYNHNQIASLEIEVICEKTTDNYFLIKIIDNGQPFNPLKNDPPNISLPLAKKEIGGLGLFLTTKLVDSFNYQYFENYNINILKKLIVK